MSHQIVSREEWLTARLRHLEDEKAFTRLRDELSRKRRALPWVRVDKPYSFADLTGSHTLGELFAGASQLIVYHFMFGTDWEAGCTNCSFWADNFNPIAIHLKARDATLVAVSRAPIDKLVGFRNRMGWSFPWYSDESDFSLDFQAAFSEEASPTELKYYNYEMRRFPVQETPGISVFARAGDSVMHTYSCYSRGLDMLNGAYHYLDLLPNGRDEAETGNMGWLRLHDSYPPD